MLRRFILVGLTCLLGAGAVRAEEETDWAALFIDGNKSGHARFVRTVQDGVVTYTQEMHISIPRLGTPLEVHTSNTSRETVEGEPLGFRMEQKFAGKPKVMVGRVADGKLHVKVNSAGQESEKTIEWPEGALMNEGGRLLMEKKGLEPGTQYTFRQFIPENLAAFEVTVQVGQKEEVDLLGRVAELTRVETGIDMHGWTVKAVSWVNEDMDALLLKMRMMFVEIKLVACPKEYALSPNDPGEFFARLMTSVPEAPPRGGLRRGLTWTLAPRAGVDRKLDLAESTEQAVKPGDDGKVAVTVRPRKMPRGLTRPYAGDEEVARAALEPSDWVQSDAALIRKLAAEAVDDEADAAAAAGRIEEFVHDYINKKGLSVGYASALEVAQSRQGDCTEHAVLTAALCQAAGIPARVVAGLAYADRFGGRRRVLVPHAWAQVYLDGEWYSLDAALDGFGAGHILLATGRGAPVDFMGSAMVLGAIRVESVTAME